MPPTTKLQAAMKVIQEHASLDDLGKIMDQHNFDADEESDRCRFISHCIQGQSHLLYTFHPNAHYNAAVLVANHIPPSETRDLLIDELEAHRLIFEEAIIGKYNRYSRINSLLS